MRKPVAKDITTSDVYKNSVYTRIQVYGTVCRNNAFIINNYNGVAVFAKRANPYKTE